MIIVRPTARMSPDTAADFLTTTNHLALLTHTTRSFAPVITPLGAARSQSVRPAILSTVAHLANAQ
jgi:hypothetical protein